MDSNSANSNGAPTQQRTLSANETGTPSEAFSFFQNLLTMINVCYTVRLFGVLKTNYVEQEDYYAGVLWSMF